MSIRDHSENTIEGEAFEGGTPRFYHLLEGAPRFCQSSGGGRGTQILPNINYLKKHEK